MKRILLALVFIALFSSTATADKKATWRNVLIGAGVFTVASGGFTYYHWNKTRAVEEEACEGGAEVHNRCEGAAVPTLTQQELDELNQRGQHHETMSYVGWAGVAIGAAVTGVAFYKFVTSKDDEPEPAVVVAPVVTREGGGATVQLRF